MKYGYAISLGILVLYFGYVKCTDESFEVSFEHYYDLADDFLPQDRPLVHLPTQGSFEGSNYIINGSNINVMRFLGIKYGSVPRGGRFKVCLCGKFE